MLILTLDASSVSASAALSEDGRLIYEAYVQNKLTHSASLLPMIDDCFRYGGKGIEEVELIGVAAGPGSFTGVRIAVATAMGLAGARPCAPLSTLEALARQAALFEGIVCPILDARGGQVYCAAYEGGKLLLPESAEALDAFLAKLPRGKGCLFVGDGAAAYQAQIEKAGFTAAKEPSLLGLHAAFLAPLALEKREAWLPAARLRPVYLRRPQAERERMQKGGQDA
ncbi:MAG: tRNA (adenosine(37)-N6)-threonylcarbamoyltransferase complex dimerization subunit type 1 TsaB [Christensenellaceae bacterium]|jgi:tRNA threonylcarbamoyladenosine biosynthesis protein TsaB|nr:tRNA (adenosine(37)-N6)-threonylcarbamoyltransferase complex dimerization subunit type 1 TsaB [Christensenellaceae bacterium]